MMERTDQEAHQQNLWDHILRSTAAPVAVTALPIEAATAEAWVTISTSLPAILSTVTVVTAIDDGDGDWIVASKPKRGDGLDVFVADLGNASSYVNAVRKNQKQKTERRKDLAYYNGVASYKGPVNNDDGQRLEKNVVEHKGMGVTNHDEVDDDTDDYDDEEVEQPHDDVGGGQDLADDEEYAAERDQEHEDYDEEHCAQNDGCAKEWVEEGGYADDNAVHAWDSGYADWNAEEYECGEGEGDYDEYGDGRWGSDGKRH